MNNYTFKDVHYGIIVNFFYNEPPFTHICAHMKVSLKDVFLEIEIASEMLYTF